MKVWVVESSYEYSSEWFVSGVYDSLEAVKKDTPLVTWREDLVHGDRHSGRLVDEDEDLQFFTAYEYEVYTLETIPNG